MRFDHAIRSKMEYFEHGKWYLHMRDHQLERAKQSERLRDWELG